MTEDPEPRDLFDRLVRGNSPAIRAFHRLFWSGIWLVFTGYSIGDILSGHWAPIKAGLAWASLAAFAVLYLVTLWMAIDFGGGPRHRARLVPYVGFVALTVAMVLGFGGNFAGLIIYAGVATGWTLRPREAAMALAVLGALSFLGLTVGVDLGTVLFYAFLTVALGATMMFFLAMIRLNIELRVAREELARLAVAAARLRFSRDLHDVLGHSLSVIALKSQVARRLMRDDPDSAETALAELESVTHQSLTSVREMVTDYRQPSLDEELKNAREVLGAAGVHVDVMSGTPKLDQQTDGLLAWAIREGVTNVLRHSRARSCRIAIAADGDGIRFEMSDDGVGAAGSGLRSEGRQGSGLRGLRERMAIAGGTLDAGPVASGGFRLAVQLPAP